MSKKSNPANTLDGLEALMKEVMVQPYIFRIMTSYNVTLSINSNWIIPERVLDDIHMLYVVSGAGAYVVEDQTIELTQNHLLFLMNDIRHHAFRKMDSSFRIIPIRFRYYAPNEEVLIKSQVKPFHFCFTPRNAVHFQSLFESIHRYHQYPPSLAKDTLCHAAISKTLAEIYCEYHTLVNGQLMHPGIWKLKEYLNDHPTERFTLQQLSKVAGLSPSYCSKMFHEAVGMPLKEYQLMKMMEYAEYLLKHSNQSVKEISGIIGYPDPYSFSKQFKKYRGYSPSSVQSIN